MFPPVIDTQTNHSYKLTSHILQWRRSAVNHAKTAQTSLRSSSTQRRGTWKAAGQQIVSAFYIHPSPHLPSTTVLSCGLVACKEVSVQTNSPFSSISPPFRPSLWPSRPWLSTELWIKLSGEPLLMSWGGHLNLIWKGILLRMYAQQPPVELLHLSEEG